MEARILLVAEDGAARERLADLLQRLRCKVALAANADEALALLAREPPELILVDLPALEAQRLRREQKDSAALAEIAFLAIGDVSEVDADGHVPRPVDAFVLHDRMMRHLTMAKLPPDFFHTMTDGEEDLMTFLKQSLSTMVAGLPGLVDGVRANRPESPDVEALLQQALRDGTRVQSFASYLDSFTAGGGERHPLDIHQMLEAVLQDGAPYLSRRATLHKRFAAVPRVMAREDLLKQVFSALIINAAQAISLEDPAQNRIEVWTYTYANGWAMVEVSDTGSGIPAELLTKIFEPYFSTRRGLGMGLGLFVARNIVTALGGRIAVESQLGRGSTFKVSLPPAETT